ncbi:hypothetical protein J6590_038694 [Homalodisca vitripennis]|nr:hypothetical protein J6590_038694 [Homalodisca vitripennis]
MRYQHPSIIGDCGLAWVTLPLRRPIASLRSRRNALLDWSVITDLTSQQSKARSRHATRTFFSGSHGPVLSVSTSSSCLPRNGLKRFPTHLQYTSPLELSPRCVKGISMEPGYRKQGKLEVPAYKLTPRRVSSRLLSKRLSYFYLHHEIHCGGPVRRNPKDGSPHSNPIMTGDRCGGVAGQRASGGR